MRPLLTDMILSESIIHLEDLPMKEFIRTVESLKDKIISEKMDGQNLWMGVDDRGFFTSREGKSPKKARFYSVDDYAMVANYNSFRAAHLALEKVQDTIKKNLQSGDMVEVEVLFGRQPNTVTYGVANKNFIVVLRGVGETPDTRVKALADALNHKTVSVESTIVSSPDGSTLELNDEKMLWEFTQVMPIPAANINTRQAMKLLVALKKFASEKNEVLTDLTNEQIVELSLTGIPKENREEAKKERERISSHIMNEYKLPIKELLLNNFVRKIKPFLQDENLHPSEDIGVEGVVVRDPVSGSQTKIVDKDVFTAINTFNSAVRAEIAGLVRTTDQDAAVEMRGGAFGQAKIRIAELLGAKELAMSSGTKRFITKFKSVDVSATALAVARSLNIVSVPVVRTKISSILKSTIQEIDDILKSFKQEAGEFKLKLKTGKEIGITPEIMKRTLTAFAETKKDIAEVNARILKSRNSTDIVMALYGKTIEALFDGETSNMKESFIMLKTIIEDDAGATDSGSVGGLPSNQTTDVQSHVGTTSAGNITPLQFKLMGNKLIQRRQRKFVKSKKFEQPNKQTMGVPESKLSILKSMTEDWAHVSDMKFAADVDDNVRAKNNVEFNQLRNDVSVGDNVTTMDVNRYLNKAHDINNEVDTVTFGMETDDGSVIKVYVNAAQGEEFENALADLLGKEDDLEEVINNLANKYDIVDVEWPTPKEDNSQSTLSTDEIPSKTDTNGILPPDEQELENPEIDLSTETNGEPEAPPKEDGGDIDLSTSSDEDKSEEDGGNKEQDEEGSDKPEEDKEQDEEGSEDRDEFGQLKKKKKKTKEESTTEESVGRFGRGLNEDTVTNAAILNFFLDLGFDISSNRSIEYQMRTPAIKNRLTLIQPTIRPILVKLQSINTMLAAKTRPTTNPLMPASQAAPSMATSSFSLIGDIIAEEMLDQGKWIVGKMGSAGLLLKVKGMTIKIDDDEADKLVIGLETNKTVSIKTPGGKRYVFAPSDNGFSVSEIGDDTKFPEGIKLDSEQVSEIIDMINS